jgi:hypothetical protein
MIIVINDSARIQIIEGCKGANRNCRHANKRGMNVHAIPMIDDTNLVMPGYHFSSRDEAIEAVENALRDAIVIESDEMLYNARNAQIAHILPKGWIDPSRR